MNDPSRKPEPSYSVEERRRRTVLSRRRWAILACSILVVALAEWVGVVSRLTVGKGGFIAAAVLTLAALSWRIWPRRPTALAGESEQLRDTRWTRDSLLVFFYAGSWGVLLSSLQFLTHEQGSARIALSVMGAGIVTASAAAVVGTLLGFLFAIPRSLPAGDRQEGIAEAAPSNGSPPPVAQRSKSVLGVNTNLEEISDWLTKIIVGLGLINLEKIPARLVALGDYFGKGFGALPGRESIAMALLILFGTSGFLMGYLLTRLYLAGAFHRALSAADVLRKVVYGISDSHAPPIAVIREVETAAQEASAEQAQRLVRKLARDYEITRRDMTFTPQRTAILDGIVLGMKGLARSAFGMLEQLMNSSMAGERLAAVAFLDMKPDPRHIGWLGARFKSETPFIMYHSALALQRLADLDLTPEQRNDLRAALHNALAGIPASDTAALTPVRETLARLGE